jgi:protoheme IX farnesyltransferase
MILYYGSNRVALALGLFAVFWYNGVYTPLKTRTAFAVIPGAFIGAMPPAIGWFSGGGGLNSQILVLSFFFFIWQVPHFWILLLNFRRDYEKVGIPALTRIFPPAQFSRIIFVWIFATAVACLMIPLFGIVESQAIIGGLMITGAWLIWKAGKFLISHNHPGSFKLAFYTINQYILLVMVLLTLDTLFH